MDITQESMIVHLYNSMERLLFLGKENEIIEKILKLQYEHYKEMPNNNKEINIYIRYRGLDILISIKAIKYNNYFIVKEKDYFAISKLEETDKLYILDIKTTDVIEEVHSIEEAIKYIDSLKEI